MKHQLLAMCLSLPLLCAAAEAQTTAPNIIEISPLVTDIRPLVVDIRPIASSTIPLETTINIIKAEPKSLVGDTKALKAETGVVKSQPTALGNNTQVIAADVSALNKAMAEIGAKETKKSIRVNLSSDVLFDFDSARIKPRAAAALAQTSLIITQRRKGWVWIYGHTDSKGSDAYNMKLSAGRANSVKTWLMINGRLPANIFATKGFGERYPIAANTNTIGGDYPQGRSRNRRVEIIIETVRHQ